MKKDKLIITNLSALIAKYGSKHKSILADLKALQAFDKTRGLSTEIVYIDKAATMKKHKGKAVTDAASAKQNKDAIDALNRSYSPDYLLLAGAQDIIPFQPLNNLLFSEDDEDKRIPSDLPYACDAAYSTDPAKFVTPSRVLGRLPDIPGVADPAYFHSLVQDVIAHKPDNSAAYKKYFSISVHEWKLSSEESLHNIFGDKKALFISPVKGPKWTATQLKPKAHFINCHGALDDPFFYGQKGSNYPEALSASLIAKKVSPGTVVAAECCYGAQLYNPNVTEYDQPSIANTYLQHHALAFVGSSTIAYGPAEGQGLADLLTQYFLINTFKGASTGRALLEARQRFLDEMGPTLDPHELKTIAQFYLLGDPSVVVVATPKPKAENNGLLMNTRSNRRDNIQAKGLALGSFIATPKAIASTGSPAFKSEVQALLKKKKFKKAPSAQTFINKPAAANKAGGTAKAFSMPVKFHVYSESTFHGRFKQTKVLVVKEKNNEIIGYREYVRR
ncbi:C25 family cysteine peptidase [uncultured Chitinophaga sp.]|uniref:C25 family cysteine peptidase n=1 Tax=uncultured Chitinophaga sp. TaxID=339340 RepID=UPI0025FABC2F|nr:C25 family cysteine peptidase [uncultured Chitinophaga sp.]